MSKYSSLLRSWWFFVIVLLGLVVLYFLWTAQEKLDRIDKKIYQQTNN